MTERAATVLPGPVASGSAGTGPTAWHDPAATSRDLEAVYRAHVGFVWRIVRRCGVPAELIEDVVHEVFLVVRRRLGEVDAAEDLRGWLFVVTRGVVANDRRTRERRRRLHERAPQPASPPDPEQVALGSEAVAWIEQFLLTLPDEQRTVFELIDIEGFTGPEVAHTSGAGLQTVYSRLRLARAAFARFFGAIREEPR